MSKGQELFTRVNAEEFTVRLGDGRVVTWVGQGREWALHGHRPYGVPVFELREETAEPLRMTAKELMSLRAAIDLLLARDLDALSGGAREGRRRKERGPLPPSAGERWTKGTDSELRERFHTGESIKAMAEHFGRTPQAIRKRLRRFGLLGAGSGTNRDSSSVEADATR